MNRILILLFSFLLGFTNVWAQKSLDFDGVNDVVTVSGYKGVTGRNARTVEAWIKIPTTATNLPIVFWGNNQASQKMVFRIQNTSGSIAGNLRFEVNGGFITGSTDLRDNKWHHVAVVWANDGTPNVLDGKLYVDGQLETVNASISWGVNTASSLDVSIGIDQNSNRFVGGLDEVRIWSSALSMSTLREWMCKEINSSHTNYSNLEAYYKLDTLSGTQVKDYSGNNRNGTRTGPTWQNYGAPVGTFSTSLYSSTGSISLKHTDGDSVLLDGISGAPAGFHLYQRNSVLNYFGKPTTISSFDSTRHWGVYFVGGINPTGDVSYFYAPNSHFQQYGDCFNELLKRPETATQTWSVLTTTNLQSTFIASSQSSGEFIIGYAGGNAVIVSPSGNDTTNVCTGDTLLIGNSSVGLVYQWLNNGVVSIGDTTPNLNVRATGNYSLIVSGGSCNDTSNILNVTFNSLPIVSLQSFNSVCESEFAIPLVGGFPLGGDYLTPYKSGNLFVVNSSGSGVHNIVYEYTDSNGCSDTASQLLKVWDLPVVTMSAISPVCSDSSAFPLTGGLPSGGVYSVKGNSVTQLEPAVLGVGSHNVGYTFIDSNGCVGSDSTFVSILALPNVSLNLIKSRFCEYDDNWILDGQNPRFGTFSGPGVISNQFSPSLSGAGNHSIAYQIVDGTTGCKNTAYDTIQVFPRPAKPVITQIGDSLKCSLGNDYRWYNLTGGIPGEVSQSFGPQKEDNYYARIQSTEGCWSFNSDTIVFKLSSLEGRLIIPEIKMYPNPTKGSVTIESLDAQVSNIRILDLNGRILMNEWLNGTLELDFSLLNKGMYQVIIENISGDIKALRLVVSE
ncbi:MAG: LamG-like jellyroll fold domain-containing protein [Salibacteraceae bacterium]